MNDEFYQDGLILLVKEYKRQEKLYENICLNGSISEQVGHSAKLQHYRECIAIVSGLAIGGVGFNALIGKSL